MLIVRRSKLYFTASGIVTLCERPCSAPVESGLQSARNSPSMDWTEEWDRASRDGMKKRSIWNAVKD
jgi:hypothetical protein